MAATIRARPDRPSVGGRALDDALINKLAWKIPNALALVWSRAGDEGNSTTTTWIT